MHTEAEEVQSVSLSVCRQHFKRLLLWGNIEGGDRLDSSCRESHQNRNAGRNIYSYRLEIESTKWRTRVKMTQVKIF
jgi:hypothetical protein